MGQIDQAFKEMDRAVSIAQTVGHPFFIGNAIFSYARLESRRNTPKAISMAEEAENFLLQVLDGSHPTVQSVKMFIARLKGETDAGR